MSQQTPDPFRFHEASTASIHADLVDARGQPVPKSALTAAQITLYDVETWNADGSPTTGVINGRHGQDVLNVDEVTFDEDADGDPQLGHVIWRLSPDDNPIVNPRRQIERHRALLTFAWADGGYQREAEIEVVNLRGAV